MATGISTNEISAYFRSSFPEISGDSLSRRLCSSKGIEFADDFQRNVYPLVGLHLSVRSRYFFERVLTLESAGKFDALISIGSGLSLLTFQVAKAVPGLRCIDADLPEVIGQRRARLKELGKSLPVEYHQVDMQEFDLAEASRAKQSLSPLIKRHNPIIVLEGVSYYLQVNVLRWLFDQTEKIQQAALIFDYWPDYSHKSAVFRAMIKKFSTGTAETVHTTLSEAALREMSSMRVIEDIEVTDAEKEFVSEPRLGDLEFTVPARFRILASRTGGHVEL